MKHLAPFTFAALVLAAACTASVDLNNRSCPCATGWQCCSNDLCVPEGMSCGTAPPPKDSGATSTSDASTEAPLQEDGSRQLAVAQSARCMTTDATHLYWQNANGLVVRVPKTGGALEPSHFHTPSANNPRCGIIRVGDNVFATGYEYGLVTRLSVPVGGVGALGGVSQMLSQFAGPVDVTADSAWLYVVEQDGGRITRVSLSDYKLRTVLAEGLHHPLRVVVSGDNLYVAERGLNTEPNASVFDGAIVRVPKDGSAFTRIVSNLLLPQSLAVLGERVYWTDASKDGTLRSAALDGTGSQAYSALSKGGYAAPLAANSTALFSGNLLNLTRAAPYAGTNTGLTPLLRSVPHTLVADETRVYWSYVDRIYSLEANAPASAQ